MDYFSATADEKRGLAKVATLIKAERGKGCTLLIDSGDTIQGTPLGTYYALSDTAPKHPMAVAMEPSFLRCPWRSAATNSTTEWTC